MDPAFVETLEIDGVKIDVFVDDYTQCYLYRYIDEDNRTITQSCGTYNLDYLEFIYSEFDPKGTYISLYGEEQYKKETKRIEEIWKKRRLDIDYPEEFNRMINYRKHSDYQIYDFDKMYEDRKETSLV